MSETLNITEAASFLGLHVETLRQRAAAGRIPGAKIGRSWVFVKSDLLDHIRKGSFHTDKLLQRVFFDFVVEAFATG